MISLLRFLLVATGAATLAAQSLSVVNDAVCGPRWRVPADTDADSVLTVEGSDSLDPGSWETLVRLGPGESPHDWLDPEHRAKARRFYRLARQPRPPLRLVDSFRLTDHMGRSHDLFREGDARAIVLAFTEAGSMAATWSQLRPVIDRFATNGILFWMIDPLDDRSRLLSAATNARVTIPVLHDAAQLVTRTFNGRVAGEVVVIDNQELTEIYRGPVEADCAPGTAVVAGGSYLVDALNGLSTGRRSRVQQASAAGTPLTLASQAVANYRTEIAPLLQTKCVTCHKPGDIGNWSMTNHASIVEHASEIRAHVLGALMPPWHADPAFQKISNDFSMTPGEQARLVAWLDAGAPRGDGLDPLENVPPPTADWPMGPPDVVLTIPRQSIPATGLVDYKYPFLVNPLRTNAWLRAAVVRPGNRQVVHHALVFFANGGSVLEILAQVAEVRGGLGGFFAGYVPGMDQGPYPAGTGKFIRAGGVFVFQMHYTTTGTATTDQTQIGLYLAAAPPAAELKTGAASTTSIAIPPRSRDYELEAEKVFNTAVDLYEFSPHMHLRGDWMRFEAVLPDGSVETLVNVPHYDFAWQTLYRLEQPRRLPAGSRFRVRGGFDNTRWNPALLAGMSDDTARFGEQTGDEMFIGYVNYAEVR
jgi:hypothetical protein